MSAVQHLKHSATVPKNLNVLHQFFTSKTKCTVRFLIPRAWGFRNLRWCIFYLPVGVMADLLPLLQYFMTSHWSTMLLALNMVKAPQETYTRDQQEVLDKSYLWSDHCCLARKGIYYWDSWAWSGVPQYNADSWISWDISAKTKAEGFHMEGHVLKTPLRFKVPVLNIA